MLTREQNDLLTRTGSGTPGGDLMRRYWQPAALSEELPRGGAPVPVALLGQELVLFRDEQGRPGLLGLHCSHRGADLSYGRLEAGGGCGASTTAGSTTSAAAAWSSPASRPAASFGRLRAGPSTNASATPRTHAARPAA